MIQVLSDGWLTVKLEELIDVDLEESSIFLQTNNTVQSGNKLTIWYLTKYGKRSGGISLWFNSNGLKYKLVECGWYKLFQANLQTREENEWVIEKHGYRTIIHCNGKVVVNVTASKETCDMSPFNTTWPITWNQEVVKVKFPRSRNKGFEAFSIKIGKRSHFCTSRQDTHEIQIFRDKFTPKRGTKTHYS